MRAETDLRGSGPTFGSGFITHFDVIFALVRRDVYSRFSGNFIGLGWAYIAPLVWIAATYFAFILFGRTVPVYTDMISFIISGLIPYAGFRYVVTNVSRTNATIQRLLIFPTVKIEHAVAGAALIETANIILVFGLVWFGNYLAFDNAEADNPLQWLEGIILACGLGASYSYLFVALTEYNAVFRQLGAVILRPAFFISAIFFTANELPDRILPFFAWNPLLHAIEIARGGMLLHYESRVATSLYALAWVIGLGLLAAAIRLLQRS